MFDPYHKWLGIPKDQRPPTHYQLLGVAPNETDAEVIDEAAVRQTTHVRAYQIGPHAAECTKVLNEIAQAKLVLLNPAKRKAYDEQLARSQANQITAAVLAVGAAPAPAAFRFDEEDVPIARPPRRDLDIAKPPKSNTALVWILTAVGAGVVLLLGTIVTVVVARRPEPGKPAVVVKKEEKKEPAPILQIPEDPNKEKPPIVKPPIVQPPIVQPPPPPPMDAVPAANVPGARSFRIKENRIEF